MLEVEIQNFQSIQREVVKIEGFTALVGRSNIGKSAVVRAVKAALTGAPVDTLVRHDPVTCERLLKGNKSCKCSCVVHIKTEGFDLLWEKGDKVNRYEHNGQEYTVVGKGTPEFLRAGFEPVKVGDKSQLIQVSDQFHPVFLLDQSGGVVADVLSDVARLDHINTAMGYVEKDRREATAARKVREGDATQLKVKVAAFEGLDDTLKQVQEVEAQEAQVDAAQGKVDKLVGYWESVSGTARVVKALLAVEAIEVPSRAEVMAEGQRFEQLTRYVASVGLRTAGVTALEPVTAIEIPSVNSLSTQEHAFSELGVWLEIFRRYKVLLAGFRDIDAIVTDLPDYEELWTLFDRFQGAVRNLKRATIARDAWRKLQASVKEADEELAAIKAEAEELGVCPTCSQPVLEHQVVVR